MQLLDVRVGDMYFFKGLECEKQHPHHCFNMGDIITVVDIDQDTEWPIKIQKNGTDLFGYCNAENLKPLNDRGMEDEAVWMNGRMLNCDGSSGNLDLERSMAEIMVRVFETFKKKQASYGSGNISSFGEFGVIVRMNDKMERLKNLVVKDKDNPLQDETIDDTYLDLADYALIAVLVRRGLWS